HREVGRGGDVHGDRGVGRGEQDAVRGSPRERRRAGLGGGERQVAGRADRNHVRCGHGVATQFERTPGGGRGGVGRGALGRIPHGGGGEVAGEVGGGERDVGSDGARLGEARDGGRLVGDVERERRRHALAVRGRDRHRDVRGADLAGRRREREHATRAA